ncbi:MAG: GTP-binding protein [Bacteroidota bacterium]
MEILRIATAGSVDDGKSTLIGRLLHDTQSITADKLEAIQTVSKRKGLDFTDLSLLTDGLIAEREQGITIDVAHIYFSTPQRKYIIADTPGHEEYTRNMVTGTSTAQASLILIDVRNGVVEQTHRHFYIASLLKIPNVVVCVNKMDLVGYKESAFDAIVAEFEAFAKEIQFEGQQIQYIPISSLWGDNVVEASAQMSWYDGDPLLKHLERIQPREGVRELPARMVVQSVIRPRTEAYHDYRAYAGKVASGSFRVGDEVIVLPSRRSSTISAIERYEEKLDVATPGQSISISLTEDVDVSRGEMLVKAGEEPVGRKELQADICWMDHQPLLHGKMYVIQHGTQTCKAKVIGLHHKIDITTGQVNAQVDKLGLNDIGQITLKTANELFFDPYNQNPANGAFIVIDPFSNHTVGVGFVKGESR